MALSLLERRLDIQEVDIIQNQIIIGQLCIRVLAVK